MRSRSSQSTTINRAVPRDKALLVSSRFHPSPRLIRLRRHHRPPAVTHHSPGMPVSTFGAEPGAEFKQNKGYSEEWDRDEAESAVGPCAGDI